jgi:actin related protein 2/3 complex subunit 2
VSGLRKHVLGWAFVRALEGVAAGAPAPAAVLRTRPAEPVYVLPRADRVTVIFHLQLPEATDRAMARVICQELTEAGRAVNAAPPAAWSEREPPLELKGLETPGAGDAASVGYVTFSLFASAYRTPAQRAAAAATLGLFRDFLAYHLKAAKTYLHARMRRRAEDLQKVLNRAAIAEPDKDVRKTTSGGKTFNKS